MPRIATVALLGHGGSISFEQTGRGLAIDLPEQKPCEYVQCYRIELG